MKFGKEFGTHLEETLPEWRDKFLCYKLLKKLLKNLPTPPRFDPNFHLHRRPGFSHPATASAVVDDDHPDGSNLPLVDLQDCFVRILNEELEKFNDFYVDKEEEFIIRFQELKERIELVKEKSKGGILNSESEFSEETMDIRKDFVTIHGEMVLLKNYSSLNFAGVIKILKKYDKRTGGLLRLPFSKLALHQPFFTTGPLTRLVLECESNLELLFPLEAEVIESTPTTRDQPNLPVNNKANITPQTASTLGEETVDVYRCTLAAMKTIRGLRKESSTCNPLSFSSLVNSQKGGCTSAVTTENSASSSSITLQNEDEGDKEDTNPDGAHYD
ncbi:SPX domain-containing protein [Cephalotus follicularis]|uniref:SPX domain-containing protein n=1 Tax=Cephalotus follicularis TaxID=3775 RepID=A0A1Q3CBG3_CEPFO|nr:SPX domain-containing protein [Cephalotus follicularis]